MKLYVFTFRHRHPVTKQDLHETVVVMSKDKPAALERFEELFKQKPESVRETAENDVAIISSADLCGKTIVRSQRLHDLKSDVRSFLKKMEDLSE